MRKIIMLIALYSMFLISANASEECINWEWIQTGSHTECSSWYCWNVPEYSFICTEYAQDQEPIIPPHTTTPTMTLQVKQTSIGFAYTFGNNDIERYQTQKNISDMRAMYIMENIAWSYGLYTNEFEKKYNIK